MFGETRLPDNARRPGIKGRLDGGFQATTASSAHAQQANNAHDDQVDRDDVVEQARHQQNQNAGDQGCNGADAERNVHV